MANNRALGEGQKMTDPSGLSKNGVLELSSCNFSDDDIQFMDDDEDLKMNQVKSSPMKQGNPVPIEDFESFKKQFNIKEILDKLIIKREFFIPSKAMDINQFYVFEKELGEGAYGKVYLAKHKKSGKLYMLTRGGIKRAIKLIAREKIKRFDRFINEIRALKTLVLSSN